MTHSPGWCDRPPRRGPFIREAFWAASFYHEVDHFAGNHDGFDDRFAGQQFGFPEQYGKLA
ncbi:MAG TPA: hypothetical protein VHY91_19580 [Pirellulales bacterium]|jgi:hypothetical protein|nr:hypothetical protein [Pirellulales bacterium]